MTRFAVAWFVLVFVMAVSGCDSRRETPAAGKPAATRPEVSLIDINRASAEELMTLKGIGEVRASNIIYGRPYARKDELVKRGIVPYAVYDSIKNQIIARQK